MQRQLSMTGQRALESLAQRYGVSFDAVATLLAAVASGGGTMAQFYHPELGGGGQWMRGGMTMVGDMFNSRLQSTVSGLCAELSALLGSEPLYEPLPAPPAGAGFGGMAPGNNWWPGDLGSPSSSGGQNDTRYAYFPGSRRLALERYGQVTLYDTLDHQIGGVQQQQGGPAGSLSFSSQRGTFTVESLPVVSGTPPVAPAPSGASFQAAPFQPAPPAAPLAAPAPPMDTGSPVDTGSVASSGDILSALERLGQLAERGILTDEEFKAKKAELLARL